MMKFEDFLEQTSGRDGAEPKKTAFVSVAIFGVLATKWRLS
jgi:hypothetical protein